MNVRRCAHCGDELPAHHKYVYCWDGLEEFTQRQREIDEDPFVTCVAYGDFTDPRNGRNSVVVRCRRIRGKEIRQMVRAIEEVVRPWLDKGRDKTRRVGLEPEPIPYFGVDRLWGDKIATRFKWENGKLVRMLPVLIQE